MIRSHRDLEVYELAYEIAMEIFRASREFPKEEVYSLTSQVVRSSRSISANIAEGFAKRGYENHFKHHLVHSLGSTAETENWLRFAKDCGYISNERYDEFGEKLDHTGRMLTNLHKRWQSK